MLGFTTRRNLMGDHWTTHRWVIEELSTAFSQIPVVEVREDGVDPQLGMLGGNQYILYQEANRDRCLVEIAQAISRILERVSHTTFHLEPSEFTTPFRTFLNKPGLRCSYRIMRQNVESEFRPTKMWRVAGGLEMSVEALRTGDLVQVCVTYGEHSWSSDYESIDKIRITLSRES